MLKTAWLSVFEKETVMMRDMSKVCPGLCVLEADCLFSERQFAFLFYRQEAADRSL